MASNIIVKIPNFNILFGFMLLFFSPLKPLIFLLRRTQLSSARDISWCWHSGNRVRERLVLLFSQILCFQIFPPPLLCTFSGFSGVKLLALHFPEILVSVVGRRDSCLDLWEGRRDLRKFHQFSVQMINQPPWLRSHISFLPLGIPGSAMFWAFPVLCGLGELSSCWYP